MTLKKIKNDIHNLKKDMDVDVTPDLTSFNHWCRRFYGRSVNGRELMYTDYKCDGKTVKADPDKYLRLSDRYFRQIHNCDNPVKDGDLYSFKFIISMQWRTVYKDKFPSKSFRLKDIQDDPEFSEWFEIAWNQYIDDNDATMFNELIRKAREVEKHDSEEFKKRFKCFS